MILERARYTFLVLTLFLSSCNKVELVQDVSQEQAHKIVAALHHEGITSQAEKQVGAGSRYTVRVKQSLYSEAVNLIIERGLPGKPREEFSEIVRQKGLIPNSRDIEKLRLDHALSVQVEEMLLRIPGVQSVRAVVRAHFVFEQKPAGASLVLTVKPNIAVAADEVLDIVSSAVPTLQKEQIHLSLHTSKDNSSIKSQQLGVLHEGGKVVRVPLTKFLFDWRVSEADHNSLALFLAAILVFVGFVGAVIGYWLAYLKRPTTRFAEDELPHLRTNVLKLDSSQTQSME